MRDPNRIHSVIETIRRVWYLVPDWRLGQLICNLARDAGAWDSFYAEDDVLEAVAKKWLAQSRDKSGEFMICKKTFSNFQDAVEAAKKECGLENFEIRSNANKTYDLIYETAKEDEE